MGLNSPPPSVVDARARAAGATIATIRDLIPRECHRIDPWRSWTALLVCALRTAFALFLLTLIEPTWGPSLAWQIPALVAAWVFCGWCYTGIFVLGHDCGHMAFSERRWVNELVGHLCLSPVFTAFHNWRIGHNYHHAKTQLRGQDTDWAERMSTRAEYDEGTPYLKAHVRLGFGTPIGWITGFWVGIFRRMFMRTFFPQVPLTRGAERELLLSNVVTVIVVGALTAALYRHGGAWAVLKYYYVPSIIAATTGAMLTYLHHTSADSMVFDRDGWTPFRGQVVSTFNVRFPRWIEALWFDINIHLVHHLAPKVPWYHLNEATEAIRAANSDWVQERRFSLAYVRAAWARPLLGRVPNADYFQMTAFSAAADEQPASTEAGAATP